MKYFYFGILSLACVWVSQAQTNVGTNGVEALLALVTTNQPAPPVKKPSAGFSPVRGKIVIQAIGPAVLDMKSHWMTYSENVIVTNAQMKLTCEWLLADLPQNGEQITNIVAKTNVVMVFTDEKGEQRRGTGDMAVYFYHVENAVTNETITLTGNPENPPMAQVEDTTMHATNFVYDCITERITANGPMMGVYLPSTNTPAGTNRPAGPKLF